jgi:predicted Zn-dependent protease
MFKPITSLILITSVATLLFSPILVNGYASEVKLSDCKCKWYKPKLIVWIDNNSETKYTDLAIDAINEWQSNFKQLSYTIHTIAPDNYDIVITIHKMYGKAVGLPREAVGLTMKEKKLNSDELVQATIEIPTYYRNAYGSTSKISDAVFYNMVLHEFGHAIGLGHAVDNKRKPIDPMYHMFRIDEDARKVSKLDVAALESLYKQ